MIPQATILLHDADTQQWLQFKQPVEIISVTALADVRAKLAYVEDQVNTRNLWAAGFLSYEAAGAFDAALVTYQPGGLPLLYFGLYAAPTVVAPPQPGGAFTFADWAANVDEEDFGRNIDNIKSHIARGETYQVNYTFRLRSQFSGDAHTLFANLHQAQRGAYSAFIDSGEWAICSASPELFFTLDGNTLRSKPMKGTHRRGLTTAQDDASAKWLQQSEKNRAENVMIVDMIRNDMGRVAQLGSVHVPTLFEIERYPTVLQMTSTVASQTEKSVSEIMAALFPCASITGAPKVRTMEIIHSLEQSPRGVYCGSIGFIAPNRRAQFSVAIRTVTIMDGNSAEYGTGSGVIWDSEAGDEFRECLLKAAVLGADAPQFELIESLLWRADDGYWLLDEHLDRINDSLSYFHFRSSRAAIEQALLEHGKDLTVDSKVRLLLSRNGQLHVESAPIQALPTLPQLGFATSPVDSGNRYLYHKTTQRQVYADALASRPDCDDVLLWNERDEVTEASSSNVVFEIDGQLVTPPISSGILGGTLRRTLLEAGVLEEATVSRDDARNATRLWLINSVRGWREAILIDKATRQRKSSALTA